MSKTEMARFVGKVALVTGAGAGLGRAVALRLAGEGASVIVNDIDLPSVEETAKQVKELGRRTLAIQADLTKDDEVKKMAGQAIKKFGRVDILINNAGVCPLASFLDEDRAGWERAFTVNATSQFLTCKALVPQMIERKKGGKIVNIASDAGKEGYPLFLSYCASKHAVLGLTRTLAKELAQYKINVNAVCPNSMSGTKMRKYVDVALEKAGLNVEKSFVPPPLGRMVKPEEVAGLVAYLASKDSDMMTGQAVNFTGGAEIH